MLSNEIIDPILESSTLDGHVNCGLAIKQNVMSVMSGNVTQIVDGVNGLFVLWHCEHRVEGRAIAIRENEGSKHPRGVQNSHRAHSLLADCDDGYK